LPKHTDFTTIQNCTKQDVNVILGCRRCRAHSNKNNNTVNSTYSEFQHSYNKTKRNLYYSYSKSGSCDLHIFYHTAAI